ncbi:MAG: hypothetical protein ABSG59_17105 [Verrucomicrobiota bacterium]
MDRLHGLFVSRQGGPDKTLAREGLLWPDIVAAARAGAGQDVRRIEPDRAALAEAVHGECAGVARRLQRA